MSILIPGMEMPKPKLTDMATVYNAYVLVSPDGHATIVVDNEDGLDSTEYLLVSAPPHGRLLDTDVLRKAEVIRDGDAYAVVMPRDIEQAPTAIIPAEEGE